MVNKHRGEVEVMLDQLRTFRFTSNSLAKMDKVNGFIFTKINEDTAGAEVIRAMVWAALLHEHPHLTLEEAGDLMDLGGYVKVSTKVFEAFALALSDGEEKAEKNEESGLNSVGKV